MESVAGREETDFWYVWWVTERKTSEGFWLKMMSSMWDICILRAVTVLSRGMMWDDRSEGRLL